MTGNFDLMGTRWGKGAMGAPGGVVTWSVDATIETTWVNPIANAFADWAQYANISFAQVAAAGDIRFTEAYIDGPGKTLGHARTAALDDRLTGALVTIDSAEDYHVVNGYLVNTQVSKGSRSFDAMITHEIGHALGIDHLDSGVALARMNPYLNTYVVSDLTKSDIDAIQAIYGVRPGAPVATAETGLEQADAIFRFHDTKTGDHFYTTSVAEKLDIQAKIPHYVYEGVAWGVPHEASDTIDVFRFFDTKSGEHFFTTSEGERDNVIKNLPTYKFEGVAFQAYAQEGGEGTLTLDRFFNTKTGVHHFSAGAEETAGLKAGVAGPEWVYEGHGFTVAAPSDFLLNA
jgi:hypothetical protein